TWRASEYLGDMERGINLRSKDTEADLIERYKLLKVFWVVIKQWLKYLTKERHKRGGDRGNSRRRECLRCYEWESVGHIKADYPVAQQRELKCSECRAVGHTRREYQNSKKDKGRNPVNPQIQTLIQTLEDYHVMLNKWLNLKNENLSLQHDLVQSREQYDDLAEELAVVHEKNESLEKEVSKLRQVATGEQERARMLECDLAENRKQIRMLNSGSNDLDKILSMGQPAKVNLGLGYRGAESTKEVQQKGLSYFVHGNTSKSGAKGACQEVRQDVRQEVLKHGCVAGTRKVTDQCISNCVRPNKKQHRMCCWFCGNVGHKKVECFAREKNRNMAKMVNKTFTKLKRVEEVFLAKNDLLDEIKDEISEEGCSSVRSDLEVDQEASSLEPGHEVVCGTKGKEIEVHQGRMVMFWYRECISHRGEKHIWCGSFQVMNVVVTLLLNQKNVVLDRHTKLKGGD
ncbi:hypothetical protein IGI04_003530, partial [Brassica rapa subsp. trilocularis]